MILTVTLNPAIDTRYFIDNFEAGKLFRANKIIKTAGGKGLNVTRVLNQLGANVVATGVVGGKNGEWIVEKLNLDGINENFYKTDKETRVCIAVLDLNQKLETEILEASEEISQKELEEFEKIYELQVEKANIITMSGSLLKGANKNYYEKIVKIANEKGKKVILDTSGEALIEGIKANPYLIKPNFDEMEFVLGEKIDSDEKIKKGIEKLRELGAKNILLSLGKNGAMYFSEDGEVLKVTIPKIEVINTVGSGDSTVAGFAKGLNDNLNIFETLKLAMACGMSNAQSFATGEINVENVQKFVKEIKVEKVNFY